MTEDAAAPSEATEELRDTGNYPEPLDGPQDDVEQTTLPDFDEDLVDGADLEADDDDLPGDRATAGADDPLRDDA
jgi:hypothetical protein